jgi:large conductance mechanosensitive channel
MPLKWGLPLSPIFTGRLLILLLLHCLFFDLRAAEKMKKKRWIIAAAATPVGPTQEDLLIQIRDLLKK